MSKRLINLKKIITNHIKLKGLRADFMNYKMVSAVLK